MIGRNLTDQMKKKQLESNRLASGESREAKTKERLMELWRVRLSSGKGRDCSGQSENQEIPEETYSRSSVEDFSWREYRFFETTRNAQERLWRSPCAVVNCQPTVNSKWRITHNRSRGIYCVFGALVNQRFASYPDLPNQSRKRCRQ